MFTSVTWFQRDDDDDDDDECLMIGTSKQQTPLTPQPSQPATAAAQLQQQPQQPAKVAAQVQQQPQQQFNKQVSLVCTILGIGMVYKW